LTASSPRKQFQARPSARIETQAPPHEKNVQPFGVPVVEEAKGIRVVDSRPNQLSVRLHALHASVTSV
jgi:hypothetical protein